MSHPGSDIVLQMRLGVCFSDLVLLHNFHVEILFTPGDRRLVTKHRDDSKCGWVNQCLTALLPRA